MYFQGIFYVIVIYGLSVLRVCYGHLHIFFCNIYIFLNGFSILFSVITVAMYTFSRFMFVCIWKRMRQMDDNLIVRIATNQAIFMSLLFTAVSWLQINGQLTYIQVSNLLIASLIRDHSCITSSKRWVGGVRKWQFLMIYSTVNHQRGGWA